MAYEQYGEGKWGNEFEPGEQLTIGTFLKEFMRQAKEVSYEPYDVVDGHKTLKATVDVECQNDDHGYTIVAIETDYLMGCQCPSGLRIIIHKDDD